MERCLPGALFNFLVDVAFKGGADGIYVVGCIFGAIQALRANWEVILNRREFGFIIAKPTEMVQFEIVVAYMLARHTHMLSFSSTLPYRQRALLPIAPESAPIKRVINEPNAPVACRRDLDVWAVRLGSGVAVGRGPRWRIAPGTGSYVGMATGSSSTGDATALLFVAQGGGR